jgi:hypothetical protein
MSIDRKATISVYLDESENPRTLHEIARIILECDDYALTGGEIQNIYRTDEGGIETGEW